MNKIRESLLRAKKNDAEAICSLKDVFNPMMVKYSYLFGEVDEDLYSELVVAFIKCIKKFETNEKLYIQLFNTYVSKFTRQSKHESEKSMKKNIS